LQAHDLVLIRQLAADVSDDIVPLFVKGSEGAERQAQMPYERGWAWLVEAVGQDAA
jgi:hypothetical protein